MPEQLYEPDVRGKGGLLCHPSPAHRGTVRLRGFLRCDRSELPYRTHVLEHELHPHKAVLGTETYPADIVRLWRIVEENPHMIGDFTWAGYDYLGEAAAASSITMAVPTSAAFTRNALLHWRPGSAGQPPPHQLSAGDRLRSAEGTLSGSAANGTQRSDLQQNALDVQG